MFELNNVREEEKKDLAFQLVVAMRDTISIAKKVEQKPTYESSMMLYHDFSPELYKQITDQLPQRNLSDEAALYVVKAKIKSKEVAKDVHPIELLQEDLQEYKILLNSSNDDERKLINQKISSLESLKKSLLPRKISENRILQRDFSKIDRKDLGADLIESNDFFVDYKLSDRKYLRLRLLHPDKPEHVTGADLIYEQHNLTQGKIRILFLQYKIWENGVLHFSKAKNLLPQLNKLKGCLCDSGNFCNPPESLDEKLEYRFPYCCAFLRPTDKFQDQNERLISSGVHIPVCAVMRLREIEGDKLEKRYMRYQTLTHKIFENLFNRGFIGSKWLDEEEVEKFYRDNQILQTYDTIKLYAREIQER